MRLHEENMEMQKKKIKIFKFVGHAGQLAPTYTWTARATDYAGRTYAS